MAWSFPEPTLLGSTELERAFWASIANAACGTCAAWLIWEALPCNTFWLFWAKPLALACAFSKASALAAPRLFWVSKVCAMLVLVMVLCTLALFWVLVLATALGILALLRPGMGWVKSPWAARLADNNCIWSAIFAGSPALLALFGKFCRAFAKIFFALRAKVAGFCGAGSCTCCLAWIACSIWSIKASTPWPEPELSWAFAMFFRPLTWSFKAVCRLFCITEAIFSPIGLSVLSIFRASIQR